MKRLILFVILLLGLASCQPTAPTETKTAPENVVAIREAAITYVVNHFDLGLPTMAVDGWETAVSASTDLVGAHTYQFRQDSCFITISHSPNMTEAAVYRVSFTDTTLDFYWEGEFNTAGQLIDPFSTNIVSNNPDIVR